MNFKAAIFDLDGTLFYSLNIWEKVCDQFLNKRNITNVPKEYLNMIYNMTFEESAKYTKTFFHLQDRPEHIIAEWNGLALAQYSNTDLLKPYAKKYLHALLDSGIKLAVATSLPKVLYEPALQINQIRDLFEVCCSTEEGLRNKKYPDIYMLVSKRLSIPPQECIVFEDILPGIISAKQAGMFVYGVYDSYSAHHEEQIRKIANGYLYNYRFAPLPDHMVPDIEEYQIKEDS